MRILLAIAVLTCAGCFPAAQAADTSLIGLAPQGSEVLVGFNLKQIRGAGLGQLLMSQAGPSNPDFKAFVDKAGFDPIRDIDEVVIAAPPTTGKPRAFILVRGTFDAARFGKLVTGAGATATEYHGIQIFTKPGEQQSPLSSIALIDASLLVAGDDQGVRAFVDRQGQPGGLGAELAAQAAEAAASNDIWVVLHASPAAFAPAGATPGQAVALLQSIERATIGLKLGTDIVLSANVMTHSPDEAQGLLSALQLVSGMAASSDPGANPAAAFLQKLQLESEGNAVKLRLAVPQTEVIAAIGKAMTKMAPQKAAPTPAPAQ
jgi:hypothetical protein